MPLYDFNCNTCGQFEQWLSLSQLDKPVVCPQCEAIARRIFSPPMVLTGRLNANQHGDSEPRLETRSPQSSPPRHREHRHGRPWMLGH